METLRRVIQHLWADDQVRLAVFTLGRVILAAILGGIIGYERQHSHRPAGLRTHILVAVGAALVMCTSEYVVLRMGGSDITRMGAQVISGIGFLGAGTILREGFSVKGLTTAASLWAVSCIGLAAGGGFYAGAVIGTVVIYVTLNSLKKVFIRGNAGKTLYIEAADITAVAPAVGDIVKRFGGNLHSFEILYAADDTKRKKGDTLVLKALVYLKKENMLELIQEGIRDLDGVLDLYVD